MGLEGFYIRMCREMEVCVMRMIVEVVLRIAMMDSFAQRDKQDISFMTSMIDC